MNEKIALSVPEAAELLGISVPIAYELTNRADFPSFKIGRRTLVNKRLLLEWIDGQCAETG